MARPLSPAARALRRRLIVAGVLVVALLALLVATCAREPRREELLLVASLSLAHVAEGVAADFEAAYPGVDVVVAADTLAALARKIEGGEAADVLLAADAAWLRMLAQQGRLRQPPHELFADHLVVVGSAGAVPLDSLPRLGRLRRLALPDTARTATGRHAKAGLERAGLWNGMRPRLVLTPSPRAALAAVAEGGVGAAVVLASDTLGARGVRLLLDWPLELEPPIRVAVGIPRTAPHPDRALEFVEFVRQPERALLWRRYGFSPLAEPLAP